MLASALASILASVRALADPPAALLLARHCAPSMLSTAHARRHCLPQASKPAAIAVALSRALCYINTCRVGDTLDQVHKDTWAVSPILLCVTLRTRRGWTRGAACVHAAGLTKS